MTPAAPQRIQLRRAKGWRLPDGAVTVARPTPWGNPFQVGKHGTQAECVRLFACLMQGLLCLSRGADVARAQERYRKHLDAHLGELRGKALACWCRPDQPCHADVLLAVANGTAVPEPTRSAVNL